MKIKINLILLQIDSESTTIELVLL